MAELVRARRKRSNTLVNEDAIHSSNPSNATPKKRKKNNVNNELRTTTNNNTPSPDSSSSSSSSSSFSENGSQKDASSATTYNEYMTRTSTVPKETPSSLLPPTMNTQYQQHGTGGVRQPAGAEFGEKFMEHHLEQELRTLLGDKLTQEPVCHWPEVVGFVNLLRFVRASKHDVAAAVILFDQYLDMRERYQLNDMRIYLSTKKLKSTMTPQELEEEEQREQEEEEEKKKGNTKSKKNQKKSTSSSSSSSLKEKTSGKYECLLSDDEICAFKTTDCKHGEKYAKAWRCIDFDNYTPDGDPVHMAHVGELVEWESMKIQEMRDYYLEHYVRNEMKLDVLSRRQGRVVYLVPLVVLPHLSWDFLIQTPVKVEFIKMRRDIFSCAP